MTHLSILQAMEALEASHPALARAEAQQDGAAAGTTVALSGLLPAVSLGGSYTRNNEEAVMDLSPLFEVIGGVVEAMGQEVPESPGALTLQPLQSFSGSVTVKVPLLVPSSWASVAASRDVQEVTEASYAATLSSLRATAYLAFWSAAASEQLAAFQADSVDRARKLLASTEAAFSAGTATRVDVLTAKTELARREGVLLQTTAQRDKARVAVGAAIGRAEPVVVEVAQDETLFLPERALDAAMNHRGEIRAAEAQVEAARQQVRAVQWGALPTLSGSFTAFSSTEPYVTGENYGWKASLDLGWTIATGGLRLGNLQKAQASLAEAEAQLEVLQLQVTSQVKSTLLDINAAKAQVEVAEEQHALAQELANLAQRNLEAGVGDTLRVIDSLERLDQANIGLVDAQTRLAGARINFRLAVGEW